MKTSISTELVDLHHQAPNRNRRESKYYWDELYSHISAAGFTSIEIPYEPKWDFGGRSGIPLTLRSITTKFETVDNYIRTLNSYGIDGIVSVHLDPTIFCSGNMQMYFGAFSHFATDAITFAKEANAEVVTLTATPSYYAVSSLCGKDQAFDIFEEEFLNKTAEAIDSLADIAEKAGIKLCVKNEYWGLLRGDKIVSFLKRLKKQVYLDIDTANIQIAGVDVPSFIYKNIDKIGIVHFTDTSFVDCEEAYKQPLPEFPSQNATKVFRDIGQGNVDFQAIYAALKDVNYGGCIVYNCRHSYNSCRSLLRTRYYIKNSLGEK